MDNTHHMSKSNTIFGIVILLILVAGVFAFVYYSNNKQQNTIEITESETDNNAQVPESDTSTPIQNFLTANVWQWQKTYRGTGPDTSITDDLITPKKADTFTIKFETDGRVSGTTDCNSFSGSYTVSQGKITFGPLATTRMFCPESQESEFIAMLKEGMLGGDDTNFYIEHDQTVFFVKK